MALPAESEIDLYVLRHAIAADPADFDDDAERPLTPAGIDKLRKVTRALPRLGVEVDAILSSPYVRARQTAVIAGEVLGLQPIVDPALAAGATPPALVAALTAHASVGARLLMVGHEPDLSRMISVLISGTDRSAVRMKKAGLVKLSIQGLRMGPCAQLEWSMWPKHLLRIAGED